MMSRTPIDEEAAAAFPSELESSLSHSISSAKESLESLRRENVFLKQETSLLGDEIRISEDEERQLRLSTQALENTHGTLQAEVNEILEVRSERDSELKALQRELYRLYTSEEDSEALLVGQECFQTFLKHFKKLFSLPDSNNNASVWSSPESPLKSTSDEGKEEEALRRELNEIQAQFEEVETKIRDLKDEIAEESNKVSSVSKESETQRIAKLHGEKVELSNQVARLEKEFGTLKLRRGKTTSRLLFSK